jgi:hypothetical protein
MRQVAKRDTATAAATAAAGSASGRLETHFVDVRAEATADF